MEPFCVILKRALASEHPLHQILKYHCRDVTVPNSVGTPALVGEGNFMDQLFAFGNKGTTRLLQDGYQITTWEITDFRAEIKVSTSKKSRLTVNISTNLPTFSTLPPLLGVNSASISDPLLLLFQYPPLINVIVCKLRSQLFLKPRNISV